MFYTFKKMAKVNAAIEKLESLKTVNGVFQQIETFLNELNGDVIITKHGNWCLILRSSSSENHLDLSYPDVEKYKK